MKKEFTKADLKDGMVVEYRDLSRRVVIGNSLIGENGYNILNNYNDTLLSWRFSDNDIIKVYEIKKPYPFSDMMKDRNLRLIWNRFNTICMTAEEMRKKLEELTGWEIEVEEGRKVGEWFLLDECVNSGVYCSVCHKKVYKEDYANQKIKSKFCPNCVARMEC